MGCFDFTYADNGENIRGRRGYIYLSPQVAEAINLANPVRFSTTDLYGQFSLCIPLNYGARYERRIDIFSLYHLCIQADHDQWTDDAKRFTNLISHLQFNDEYRNISSMNLMPHKLSCLNLPINGKNILRPLMFSKEPRLCLSLARNCQ